jgi:hypothetical protein
MVPTPPEAAGVSSTNRQVYRAPDGPSDQLIGRRLFSERQITPSSASGMTGPVPN